MKKIWHAGIVALALSSSGCCGVCDLLGCALNTCAGGVPSARPSAATQQIADEVPVDAPAVKNADLRY